MEDEELQKNIALIGKATVFITAFLMVLYAITFPLSLVRHNYNIWTEGKLGEAELARAMYSKRIQTIEAEAFKESAKFQAEAEVIRAKGVAEANKIIGDSLMENEAYLRYRWIEGLQTNQMQVVYVPTEAGLPILEAGKQRY